MITLAPIDYGIIAAAFTVLVVRLLVDFREVSAVRVTGRAMRTIVKQSFSPLLTVILPMNSLEATKQSISYLQETDMKLAVIVAVNSTEQPLAANKLRYYVKKHSIKKVQVVSSKKLNLTNIAKQRVTSGLIVTLPDTARLHKTFYYDAILPFGEGNIDAVRLQANVRPYKTLTSGIEALFVAWRNYFDFSSPRIDAEMLLPGVIMRVKHLRRQPKRKLNVITTQKAVFSVESRPARDAWKHLLEASSVRDLLTVSVLIGTVIAVLYSGNSLSLVAGVFALLYGTLVWWSLGSTRNTLMHRISLILLAPFFFIGLFGIVMFRIILILAYAWAKGYRLLRGLGGTRNRTLQYIGE